MLESSSSANGGYLVRGKLYEFRRSGYRFHSDKDFAAGGIGVQETNRNVWDRLVEREEPVSRKSVRDVVQSLDRNLQHVVSETVAEIDKFLAAPR